MISSVIRLCVVAYLLLSVQSALTSASPVKQTARKYCGDELRKALDNTCEIFSGYFSSDSKGDNDLKSNLSIGNDSLTSECCTKGCTLEYLKSYCGVVKNQTSTADNQLDDVYRTSTIQSVMSETETFAPTDPPNRPEISYDGEYSDLEPLTLLPTYTSPEYSNDLLVFRP